MLAKLWGWMASNPHIGATKKHFFGGCHDIILTCQVIIFSCVTTILADHTLCLID